MQKLNLIIFTLLCLWFPLAQANTDVSSMQDEFIEKMASQYDFDATSLKNLFSQVIVSETILKAISKPAEKRLPWYKYRNIFLKKKRINEGVEFLDKNREKLQAAEKQFGVPAEIITAIIGVETFYGRIAGSYRVVDALNTLGFHYPKRAAFFRNEFEQFLLLAREQGFDPLSLKGSYAGAMGMPQFISSSYRHYAIDFDGDDIIDIVAAAKGVVTFAPSSGAVNTRVYTPQHAAPVSPIFIMIARPSTPASLRYSIAMPRSA